MAGAIDTAGVRAAADRVAAALAGLTGGRRMAVAAGLGAVASLGLPPAYLVPVWWLVLPALIWLLRGAGTTRTAFWTGWWFGFGHFTFSLYWIAVALWVDIARFWWAVPLALAGLPMVLSAFIGAATAVWSELRRRFALTGVAEVLAFAVLWSAAEWLRGHLFTGFPWNLAGYGWSVWLPVLQTVSLVGIYGLSLLTVAAAGLPAILAGGRGGSRALAAVLAGVLVFAGLGLWGGMRMAGTGRQVVPDVTLRLVQASIPQRLKGTPEARAANFQAHLRLSAAPGWDRVTHIIWPETAVPWLLVEGSRTMADVVQAIRNVTPPGGLTIAGTPRGLADGGDGRPRFWNSMVAVDGSARVVATYDKSHLVPFGEYMPLRRLLPEGLVSAVAAGAGDYSPGPGPRTLSLPGLPPVSPLICYEVLFPGKAAPPYAADAAGEGGRPAWLLNLTNDAWYGETAGPWQHFDIARVRAVEEGLPLVRSANSGISGIVDAYGRVTASLGLNMVGVVDAPLPVPAARPTAYARWGDGLFALMLAMLALATAALARRP
ncbi:MAG: putative apolipoprotein N-acyltransferase Lnt [Pseudomonadota bacterium]|jgi:apolipoprotein N-acyltransferase